MLRHHFRRALHPLFLPAVGLLGLTCAATAQDGESFFFTNNATVSSEVKPDTVLVGYASLSDRDHKAKPTSPTINIVKGGIIAGRLYIYNSSKVEVRGRVSALYAHDKSVVTFSNGGSISGTAEAHDKSVLNINGGDNISVEAFGNSVVNIRGGSFGIAGVGGIDTSTFNFYGSGLKSRLYIPGSNVYIVSGKLADGTPFDRHLGLTKNVKIVLHNMPAPAH